MIVPLHNHSEFSALDGMATVDEIAKRAVEIGCPCCGLTDHGVVAGHLDFAKAFDRAGIKPVFGCELYHGTKTEGFKGRERDQSHLIALAMTDEGLRNLWRLTHATSDERHFHNVGRVFWEDLERHREGLVITSACALGLVPKGLLRDDYEPLNRYLDIFGDDFYIEIHTYPYDKPFNDRDADAEPINMQLINELLVATAQERGIPIVYANDAHYAFPDQYEQHDMYLALQTGQSVHTPIEERTMWHPPGALAMMTEPEVRLALHYLPESVVDEALANSVVIGERAQAQLPEIRRHMPAFIPADCPFLDEDRGQEGPEELFIDLVVAGIYERYGPDPSAEVWERVHYELEVCIDDGLHHYLLWGWDEISFCDAEEIPYGPGRGSSAGCICAYALGITDVDPLHYGLIFERFWNSGRADGFPDIDSDFSQARRQEVIAYLEARLGHGNVCQIGTIGRMKPLATIDRLSRGTGISQEEANALKDIVRKTHDIEIHGVDQIGWSPELEPGKVIYVQEDVGDEVEKWIHEDRGREQIRERFVRLCELTNSRVQLYGVHPSGVVISDVPIADELPAYRRGGKAGIPATQFPMDDVDKRQFVKLDVLGLRTLDTLEHWRTMMRDDRGVDIKWSGLDLEDQPDEMWNLLRDGYTAGIFQIETPVGKRLSSLMEPHSLEDLVVINAINRPGPNVERYLAKRNGEEPITYPHPRLDELLRPILAPTYGEFVFQEQVIAYFSSLGYSLGEADAVRKILGKKKPEALAALHDGLDEWDGRGYLAMADAAGVPQVPAQSVWDGLERFASYAFNKCCHAKTEVHLPDGSKMHISKAFHLQPPEIMSMWSDGTLRPHKVHRIVKVGKKQMLEIRTVGGRVFRGTREHRLLTTEGYRPIDEMYVGMELVTPAWPVSETTRQARRENMRRLNLRPEREAQDQRAAERMRQWQAERGYDAQVAHITKVHAEHPEIVENLRSVQALAIERIKWLHANDPEWRQSFIERSLTSVRAAYDTGPGYGHCSVASDGTWCASNPERSMCEWLIANDIEFEAHKVLPTGRICDFYFDGVYWEMDGMDREPAYFAAKYDDLPYVVVTPEDYRFVIEHHLQMSHVENGDPIASIVEIGESEAYDIEMDPDGPLNWVANSVISHNSHAAAYGIIGFRCLYAKYYGPAQFYASCVRTAEGDKRHEMLAQYVNEARRMGLNAFRPDIVLSQGMCSVDADDDIWFGFADVKGVGASGEYMAELRDQFAYHTPEVFYEQFEALNNAYLKQRAANKKALLKGESDLVVLLDPKSPKQRLGANKIEAIYKAGAWDNIVEPEISMSERQELEQELLGVVLTDSTKEALEANVEEIAGCDDWEEIVLPWSAKVRDEFGDNADVPEDHAYRYEACGIVTNTQEKRGRKSGKSFGIVTIEYGRHELEFVVFNRQWKSHKFLWRIRTPGIFTIKHSAPSEYGESYQFLSGKLLKP